MAATFPAGISQATAPDALPTVPEIEAVADLNAASYDAVVFITSNSNESCDVPEPVASAVPRLAAVSALPTTPNRHVVNGTPLPTD